MLGFCFVWTIRVLSTYLGAALVFQVYQRWAPGPCGEDNLVAEILCSIHSLDTDASPIIVSKKGKFERSSTARALIVSSTLSLGKNSIRDIVSRACVSPSEAKLDTLLLTVFTYRVDRLPSS